MLRRIKSLWRFGNCFSGAITIESVKKANDDLLVVKFVTLCGSPGHSSHPSNYVYSVFEVSVEVDSSKSIFHHSAGKMLSACRVVCQDIVSAFYVSDSFIVGVSVFFFSFCSDVFIN